MHTASSRRARRARALRRFDYSGVCALGMLITVATSGLIFGITQSTTTAHATTGEQLDCYSRDIGRRLNGCTKLLEVPGLSDMARASAYAMRALALSLLGRYAEAITDYDRAIELDPNRPVVLNNRAWAKFRAGRGATAWPDINRSLELDPFSAHAYDTRAHLHHEDGKSDAALADYNRAMQLGGPEMVKLYQCGLQAAGHYRGPVNGLINEQLVSGLKACVADRKCDPLPPDEECKAAMS